MRVGIEIRPNAFTPTEAQSGPDPAFWTELNATIDEFFTVVAQSRTKIAELSLELEKRDAMITLLEAQNVSLKARLGIADSAPNPPKTNSETPTDRRGHRSIWGKLSDLERDGI